MKAAAKESRKEQRPGERVKQMMVVLDRTLLENAHFMAEFAPSLKELGMEYVVSDDEPGIVQWKRVVTERTLNHRDQVVEDRVETEEDEMLVVLEAQGFVGLVHHSKQAGLH